MENIFHGVKARLDEEEITELLSRPGIRIERIVSTGQASPPDFWYDQPNDEWVIVLTDSAGLAVVPEVRGRGLAGRDDALDADAGAGEEFGD
ncbi:MAG: hypothetical protein RLO48_15805, partial [Bauldia litoralis]